MKRKLFPPHIEFLEQRRLLAGTVPHFDQDAAAIATNDAATHSVAAPVVVATSSQLITPTITWPTPAPITYGTPISNTQLNAKANVPGTFTYFVTAGTILPAGTQPLAVQFTPTDTTKYAQAIADVNLVINKADPKITWPTPASITYGTALGAPTKRHRKCPRIVQLQYFARNRSRRGHTDPDGRLHPQRSRRLQHGSFQR